MMRIGFAAPFGRSWLRATAIQNFRMKRPPGVSGPVRARSISAISLLTSASRLGSTDCGLAVAIMIYLIRLRLFRGRLTIASGDSASRVYSRASTHVKARENKARNSRLLVAREDALCVAPMDRAEFLDTETFARIQGTSSLGRGSVPVIGAV